jgi:predicted Zn finger-like uncharacterized protein
MVVVCPACGTRFLVDDAALGGAAGRRVRCANCGNLWHHSPESAVVAEATGKLPEPAPAPVGESARLEVPVEPFAAAPAPPPRPSVAAERPAGARPRSMRLGGLGLFVVAAAVVALAIFARDTIIARWPASRPVYETLHLVAPGAGLHVTVTPTRIVDALIINGSIVNRSSVPRQVPPLRVTLRDGNEVDIASKRVAPPVGELSPGATVHFTARFEHPGIAATGVEVTFDTH